MTSPERRKGTSVHPFSISCAECGAAAGDRCKIRPRDLYAATLWKLYRDPNPFIHIGRWFGHYPNNVDWDARLLVVGRTMTGKSDFG